MSITHVVLWIVALVLVVFGAVTLLDGALVWGLVLLGAGLLVFAAANGRLRL